MNDLKKLIKLCFIILISGISLFFTINAWSKTVDQLYQETLNKYQRMQQLEQGFKVRTWNEEIFFVKEYQHLLDNVNSDQATKARILRRFLILCGPALSTLNQRNICFFISERRAINEAEARLAIFWEESFANLIDWLSLDGIEPYVNDYITRGGDTILTYLMASFPIIYKDPDKNNRLNKELESLSLALAKGCKPNMPDKTEYENIPLNLAIANGNKPIAIGFIEACRKLHLPIDLNKGSGMCKVTPLMLSIAKGFPKNRFGDDVPADYNMSDYELSKYLLKSGANPNAADENGNTPLHIAFLRRDPEMLELLLNNFEAYLNAKNKFGVSASDNLQVSYAEACERLNMIIDVTYSEDSKVHQFALPDKELWLENGKARENMAKIESLIKYAPVTSKEFSDLVVATNSTAVEKKEEKDKEEKENSKDDSQKSQRDSDSKESHLGVEKMDAMDFTVNHKDSREFSNTGNNGGDDCDGDGGACQAKTHNDKVSEQPVMKNDFEQLREIITNAYLKGKSADEVKEISNQFIESQHLDSDDIKRKEYENIAAKLLSDLYGKNKNKGLYDQIVSEIDLQRNFERSLKNSSDPNNNLPPVPPYGIDGVSLFAA